MLLSTDDVKPESAFGVKAVMSERLKSPDTVEKLRVKTTEF